MVRLCPVGGCLSQDVQTRLDEAARVYAHGDCGKAAALYREVLNLFPCEPDALHMLGVIAQKMGKPELALQLIDAALTARQDFLSARFNRCLVLRGLGRQTEALRGAFRILETAPTFAEAWDLAGQILKDEGAYAKAHACFVHATGLQPSNPRFWSNQAVLLFTQGYPEQAADCFARVSALLPDSADAVASESMARLQIGDLTRGWGLWEQGWALWEQSSPPEESLRAIPYWQGQKVSSLLLYEDQGLGDAIHFLRYLPKIFTCADRLTLRLREPLLTLCAKNFSSVDIVAKTAPVPVSEARCRLSSLPFFCGTHLENISSAPYLTAPNDATWRNRLRGIPIPRIGLVWAGNADFRNDAARSIDFAALRPLLDCGTEHFISLQKDRSDALEGAGVWDASPHLRDFSETAALIQQLDLVISVDTATVHLAGALGKPVFVLLPFASDWRWLLGREDSPWYGTARLFRQESSGNWSGVIAAVAKEVRKFIAGDTGVLRATPWHSEVLHQNPDALRLSL